LSGRPAAGDECQRSCLDRPEIHDTGGSE